MTLVRYTPRPVSGDPAKLAGYLRQELAAVQRALASATDRPATVVTTTYAVVLSDRVLLADATGGAFTITLPAAADAAERTVTIKKTDASANAVTVDGAGSETIDGAATYSLAAQYDTVALWSDGSAWHVLAVV